jgi:hypothetical protein
VAHPPLQNFGIRSTRPSLFSYRGHHCVAAGGDMFVWGERAQLAGAVLLSALVVCCGTTPSRTASSQPVAVPSPVPAAPPAAIPPPPADLPSLAPAAPPAAIPPPPAVAPSPAPAAPPGRPPAAGPPRATAPARPGGAPPGTGPNWGGHLGLVELPEAGGTVKEWQNQADRACGNAGYPMRCLSITYSGSDSHNSDGENCDVVRVIPRSPVEVEPDGTKYVRHGAMVTVVIKCSGASPKPGT